MLEIDQIEKMSLKRRRKNENEEITITNEKPMDQNMSIPIENCGHMSGFGSGKPSQKEIADEVNDDMLMGMPDGNGWFNQKDKNEDDATPSGLKLGAEASPAAKTDLAADSAAKTTPISAKISPVSDSLMDKSTASEITGLSLEEYRKEFFKGSEQKI